MANYVESTIGANESSDAMVLTGNCDVWVSGITSGTAKIQLKFPGSDVWRDIPDNSYTSDFMNTIFLSEHGVYVRVTGVSLNTGVYVRLARGLNG